MRVGVLLRCAILNYTTAIFGQTPAQTDLRHGLEASIRVGDFVKAADLATQLNAEVQRRFLASLNVDAKERVNEILACLPADTEALMVLQEPIFTGAKSKPEEFVNKPAQFLSIDRLMAQDEGRIYQQLHDRTIRLTVAAIRDMRSRGMGVPGLMPDADVVYFYFFTEPIEPNVLGPPEEIVDSHPLWRGRALIDGNDSRTPDIRNHRLREDENWLIFARPDLLVLSSRRETALDVVRRLDRNQPNRSRRALPDNLPEWAQVNRRSPFWGIRHYSEPGARLDTSNPRTNSPGQRNADPLAIGVTVQLDTATGALSIEYLGGAANLLSRFGPIVEREFQISPRGKGVRELASNVRDKGPFPFFYGVHLLGFGDYR